MFVVQRKTTAVFGCLFCLLFFFVEGSEQAQASVHLLTDSQSQRRFLISEFTPESWSPFDFTAPFIPPENNRKNENEEKNDFKEETRLFLTGTWNNSGNGHFPNSRLPIATISVQVSFWICPRAGCFNETSTPSVTMYSYSDVICELITFQEMTVGSFPEATPRVVSYACHVSKLIDTAIPTLLRLKSQTTEERMSYFAVSLLGPKDLPFVLYTSPTQPCIGSQPQPRHWIGTMKDGNFRTAEIHPYQSNCESIGIRLNRVLVLKSLISEHATNSNSNNQIIHVEPSGQQQQQRQNGNEIAPLDFAELFESHCTFPCLDAGFAWIGIVALFVMIIVLRFCKCSRKTKVYRGDEAATTFQS